MKKVIILFAIILLMDSCTNSEHFEKGNRQLEMQGYTDIEDTGYDAFCCSEGDDYASGFTCRDKNGNIVSGCICSGILKGITIRLD